MVYRHESNTLIALILVFKGSSFRGLLGKYVYINIIYTKIEEINIPRSIFWIIQEVGGRLLLAQIRVCDVTALSQNTIFVESI